MQLNIANIGNIGKGAEYSTIRNGELCLLRGGAVGTPGTDTGHSGGGKGFLSGANLLGKIGKKRDAPLTSYYPLDSL